MRHFVQISQESEELLDLPVEELRVLLGDDGLNVKREEVVWACVLKWINRDPENRKAHIVDLLQYIRLGLVETQFFLENVSKHFISIPLQRVGVRV